MSIFTNKEHFLHEDLGTIESTGQYGKEGGFSKFLTKMSIPNNGDYWDIDHSSIDWNRLKNHYQFHFHYLGNESEITQMLKASKISKTEYLFTWLDWNDPIIKIKTSDFIRKWEEIYIASVEGMILISEDGNYIMEFTDDWKYHLNSNFEIKTNTIKPTGNTQ